MDGEMDYEFQMEWAARCVREAGEILADGSSTISLAVEDALAQLKFELSHEPAISIGASWVVHVDEHIASLALVHATRGPVVGAVCRHDKVEVEVVSAAEGVGAYLQRGEAYPEPLDMCGRASMYANVVHVPHAKCPELEMAIDVLHGRMPINVTRSPSCCCCEGLFELVSGRADVHVSPPERCHVRQLTPVPVLCAFEVLLCEVGGHMSDILGNELDLGGLSKAAVTHRGGLLATNSQMHNYFLRQVTGPFTAKQLVLPRLAESLGSDGDAEGFTVEVLAGEKSSVVQDLEHAFNLELDNELDDGPLWHWAD